MCINFVYRHHFFRKCTLDSSKTVTSDTDWAFAPDRVQKPPVPAARPKQLGRLKARADPPSPAQRTGLPWGALLSREFSRFSPSIFKHCHGDGVSAARLMPPGVQSSKSQFYATVLLELLHTSRIKAPKDADLSSSLLRVCRRWDYHRCPL